MAIKKIILVLGIIAITGVISHENKYSERANTKFKSQETTQTIDFRTLNRPFRMAKLNMLWTKAQIVLFIIL